MILLDTQVLIWFAQGEPSLRPTARALVEEKTATDIAVVSPITFWETAMLVDKGKISLHMRPLDWMKAVLEQPGIRVEPIAPIIAIDAGSLPGNIHGDPADRLIIATARHLACPLLTTDGKIIAYAEEGHLEAIDARR